MKTIWILSLVFFVAGITSVAQTKRKSRPKSTAQKAAPRTTPSTASSETTETTLPNKIPAKKNERSADLTPIQAAETIDLSKKNAVANAVGKANVSAAQLSFNYEFSQPKFYLTRVIIEHDRLGNGKIVFYKQDLSDSLTDPLTISAKISKKIQNLWDALNLIESTENYQSTERNYPHLGTMKLRRWQDDMVREVEFNWTENQVAKDLTDEYKKITEQCVWIFDMNVARENQPLNAPQLIDKLDSLLSRNQISDPKQMLDYLRQVADDERIPLLARNHTTKIIGRIEKLKEEK